jgi:ABC-type thiamine transport system ATPase subunit
MMLLTCLFQGFRELLYLDAKIQAAIKETLPSMGRKGDKAPSPWVVAGSNAHHTITIRGMIVRDPVYRLQGPFDCRDPRFERQPWEYTGT